MNTYTRPTIESIGGGGHEVDKPFWFYFLVAVAVAAVAVVAVCWAVMPPEPGTKAESF